MPRFYVPPGSLRGRRFVLSGSEAHHALHVLRKKIGDELDLFDGQDASYRGRIDTLGPNQIQGTLVEDLPLAALPVKITLFQALIRGPKWEWFLEKSCEIGVSKVVPMFTRRSLVRLDERQADAKRRRWNRIALAASKQCGRNQLMTIESPCRFTDALARIDKAHLSLIPWEKETERSIHDACREISAERGTRNTEHGRNISSEYGTRNAEVGSSNQENLLPDSAPRIPRLGSRSPLFALRTPRSFAVNIFIGPEGGWDAEEIQRALQSHVLPVRLGPTLLRTETAGLVAATLVLREFGIY